MAAGVTIWTAGTIDQPSGLTVSSLMLAEGNPSRILGLINDTTDLYETIEATGTFVVHLLAHDDRRMADRFAGLFPSPGGLFTGIEVEESEWGPVLPAVTDRASCRLIDTRAEGYHRLVTGEIERIDLEELADPLVYFRGSYRKLT